MEDTKRLMYKVTIKRDDDGKWGYDKTYDGFIAEDKEVAFSKVVEELRVLVKTIRGRKGYPEKVTKDIEKILKSIDNGDNEYYTDGGNYGFDKGTWDLWVSIDEGNMHLFIEIEDVTVTVGEGYFTYKEEN